MRLVLYLLGCEVFAVEIHAPAADAPQHPDLVATNRHAGEFGFGTGPVRPYWDAGDPPGVARRSPPS